MAIRLTYADLAALPADGKRHDLHEGEVSVTAAPRPRHQQVGEGDQSGPGSREPGRSP